MKKSTTNARCRIGSHDAYGFGRLLQGGCDQRGQFRLIRPESAAAEPAVEPQTETPAEPKTDAASEPASEPAAEPEPEATAEPAPASAPADNPDYPSAAGLNTQTLEHSARTLRWCST